MSRLATGGLIDRGRALEFCFDSRVLQAHPGDTLASALLAHDIRLAGRSFKYHRPRGILSAGSEEPNALVTVGHGAAANPNTRATVQEVFEGLVAFSQNRWPSLEFDVLAVNDLLSPLLGAGFYYKTFMWPPKFWERLYEPAIRRAAGLGRLSGEPDPDIHEKAFAFCDLLVIGAGPSGLMAALTAGRAGARVILADEDFRMGGRLNAERGDVGGMPGAEWAAGAVVELAGMPNVRLMPRTAVTGVYDGGTYGALERVAQHVAERPEGVPAQCFWRIAAKRAVLCAGAIERPIAFPDNDRPGVMLAGAVRAYANRWAVAAGRRVAVFTNNDDGWRTAEDLAAAGVEVVALVDAREGVAPPAGAWRAFTGAAVTGTRGRSGLTAVRVRDAGGERWIDAECLAVSGGWNPAVHLTCHLGGRPVWDDGIAAFVPAAGAVPGLSVAGSAAGAFSTAAALAAGAGRGFGGAGSGGRAGRAGGGGRAGAGDAVLAGDGRQGACVARFPERRDRQGRGAGAPGEFPVGRAHEALHDAGDGDGPGQDRQCGRAGCSRGVGGPRHRRDRHDHVPAAVDAGSDRGDGRGRRGQRGLRRSGSRRCTGGWRRWGRSSSRRGCGIARRIFRSRAMRAGGRRATVRSDSCAGPWASAT